MKEISAGGVVYIKDDEGTKILMIEDKSNRWTLPKGKNEEGETYKETAIREIREETGIIGEIVTSLDNVYYEYYHPIYNKVEKEVYFYLVKATSKEINVQLSEIKSAQWLNLDEAWHNQLRYGYDNNHNVIKKALEELGFKTN